MNRWESRNRFGILLLETKEVRWYWDAHHAQLNCIYRGARHALSTGNLQPSDNNYNEALRIALIGENGRLFKGRPQ